MDNKRNEKQIENNNTFGGFKYRFVYDDYRKELAQRVLRQKRQGAYRFATTLTAVSLFCCGALTAALLYRGASGDGTTVSLELPDVPSDPGAGQVHATDILDCGTFMVQNMADRVSTVYHIPRGVMVTYVAMLPSYSPNAGKLMSGDVIISVNGRETPDVTAFNSQIDAESVRQANLVIYREGEYMDVYYALD